MLFEKAMAIEPFTHSLAQARLRTTASLVRLLAFPGHSPGEEMARLEAAQLLQSQLRAIEKTTS